MRRSATSIAAFFGLCQIGWLSLPVWGQSHGTAVFESRTHRFDPIPEGTFAQHAFRFKNEGDAPIRILDVRPSCGCTTPEWTSDPVAPGQSGSIIALYATLGRPGPFRRDIVVDTDGEPARLVLYLEGEVVPPTVDLETASRQGNLAFDSHVFDLGEIAQGATASHTFLVRNTGSRPIRIREARADAKFLGVRFSGNPIFPGEVSRVGVTAYSAGEPISTVEVPILLVTDDSENPEKHLSIRASIVAPASGLR